MMNGLELAEQIKLIRPTTTILFMSGFHDHRIVHEHQLDSLANYIPKPFSPKKLLSMIHSALNKPNIELAV
jgi:two-component SAPR family response regulator